MPFIRTPLLPRMAGWLLLTGLLFLALPYLPYLHGAGPDPALQALAHKALLVAVGGVLGYWLDRGLFPYDRPHRYLDGDADEDPTDPHRRDLLPDAATLQVTTATFGHAMLRRAVVVAACVLGMALGT